MQERTAKSIRLAIWDIIEAKTGKYFHVRNIRLADYGMKFAFYQWGICAVSLTLDFTKVESRYIPIV